MSSPYVKLSSAGQEGPCTSSEVEMSLEDDRPGTSTASPSDERQGTSAKTGIEVVTEAEYLSGDARLKNNEGRVLVPRTGRKLWRRNVEYHGSLPPYWWDNECPICHEKFMRRLERDRHVKEVHSDVRHKCRDCEKVFTRLENMHRHWIATHSSHPPVLKCDICDKIFTQVGTLRRHEVQIHANPRRLKCKYCPATYARREKLEKHMESGKHHVEYYCINCKQNLIFKSLKAKEEHFKVIHRKGKAHYLMSCKNKPFPQRSSKNRMGHFEVRRPKPKIVKVYEGK